MKDLYLFSGEIGKHKPCVWHAKGFTLIELMVVTALITIMAFVAVPIVQGYMRNTSLRYALYQISGDLYSVKARAVRTQVSQNITFDLGNNRYTISDPARTVDLSEYGGGVALRNNPDSSPDLFSNQIQFTPRGLSDSITPTQVYVTNQDNRIYRIQTSPAGAITMEAYIAATDDWAD